MKIGAGFLAALTLAACVTVAQADVLLFGEGGTSCGAWDGETSGTILSRRLIGAVDCRLLVRPDHEPIPLLRNRLLDCTKVKRLVIEEVQGHGR